MPFKYLLLLRYLLLNVVALALLLAAFVQGWVDLVIESDVTNISVGIAGVFLVGLAICTVLAWRTSREINLAKSFDPAVRSRAAQHVQRISGKAPSARANIGGALRHRMFSRITHIRHIANSLVVLGLIGTVIGFIIALSGVDPDIATNPNAVSPMVARLIEGMSVALYTTLVGSILSIWLQSCFQILATGTATLFTEMIELGESLADDHK